MSLSRLWAFTVKMTRVATGEGISQDVWMLRVQLMCSHNAVVCVVSVCRFIEYGEYKENQYGTSIEAIRTVQAKNKMCLVDVQPEVCSRNLF